MVPNHQHPNLQERKLCQQQQERVHALRLNQVSSANRKINLVKYFLMLEPMQNTMASTVYLVKSLFSSGSASKPNLFNVKAVLEVQKCL